MVLESQVNGPKDQNRIEPRTRNMYLTIIIPHGNCGVQKDIITSLKSMYFDEVEQGFHEAY